MAKSAKATNVNLNLSVSIPQEAYDVFKVVSGGPVEEYVSKCVSSYLLAYASGGLMLSEDDVKAISEALGEEVGSSADIVIAITDKAPAVNEEQGEFLVKMDPSLAVNVKSSADVLGITVDQWLQNCWGHIMANGWLYGISGDIRWIPFDLNQIKEIEKAYGKSLDSSSSICNVLADRLGAKG